MKQTVKRATGSRISRFALVGVFNTIFDFTVFNILLFGFDLADSKKAVIVANTISATLAALVSFILNRSFVFRSHDTPHHYALYFVLITLSGLYLIQNLIIWVVLHSFSGVAQTVQDGLAAIGITSISAEFILVNTAKAIGTLGSMIWNYNMYKHFVFKTKQ